MVKVTDKQVYAVPILHKATQIVELIARSQDKRSISPKLIFAETKIPIASCYRILKTLVAHDWVAPIPGGGYEISAGIRQLVCLKDPLEEIVKAIRPELSRLSAQTGLTAKVSIRQGDYAVTLCRCESQRETSVSVKEGAQFLLSYGSSGAILLAQLRKSEVDEILARMPKECWVHQKKMDVMKRIQDFRRKGVATDFGTYNPGYFTMSAAISTKSFQASLTVIGFPNDFISSQRSKLAKILKSSTVSMAKTVDQLRKKHG